MAVKQFLLVYEDLWGNKDYMQTDDIKQGLIDMMNDFDVVCDEEYDFENMKTNDDFISKGGLYNVIYDIKVYEKENQDEHAGRFMIFDLED